MVLPPGYEDAMLCRKGDTAVYHNASELVGAASSFWKCQNSDDNQTYAGVWIGSRTPTLDTLRNSEYDCVRGECGLFDARTTTVDTRRNASCTIL